MDVCSSSPCGPNSQCRQINNQAVCSCVPGYMGTPPSCRPECVVNSDCPKNRACLNFKCSDPCPGSCGLSALCTIVNHSPICSCPSQNTGDPFIRCMPMCKNTIFINLLSFIYGILTPTTKQYFLLQRHHHPRKINFVSHLPAVRERNARLWITCHRVLAYRNLSGLHQTVDPSALAPVNVLVI